MTVRVRDLRFKLTPAKYRAIRSLYERGWKQSAIALKYGVSQQYVSVLLRRA